MAKMARTRKVERVYPQRYTPKVCRSALSSAPASRAGSLGRAGRYCKKSRLRIGRGWRKWREHAKLSGCTRSGTPRKFAGALFRQPPQAAPGVWAVPSIKGPARPISEETDRAGYGMGNPMGISETLDGQCAKFVPQNKKIFSLATVTLCRKRKSRKCGRSVRNFRLFAVGGTSGAEDFLLPRSRKNEKNLTLKNNNTKSI